MQLELIKSCLYRLEKLMYGYNFQVRFGIEVFDNCTSYDDLIIELKKKFPSAKPDMISIIEFDQSSFWEEIYQCLNYRGDRSFGYFLDDTNQKEIQVEQKAYTDYLQEFISDKSKVFAYPDQTGIPGYPVWWDYCFIIYGDHGQCLFTYGSASD